MATGDAVQVGVAARLLNWRGENDYDVDGVPDYWTVTGSADVDMLLGHGLSGLYGTSIYSTGSGNRVHLRTEKWAVPADVSISAKLGVWTKKNPNNSAFGMAIKRVLLDEDLSEISNNVTGLASSYFDTYWQFSGVAEFDTDNFTATTAYLEVQFYRSSGGNYGIIDSPFYCWKADGTSGFGLKDMESTPTSAACRPLGTLGVTRDVHNSAYVYGRMGGQQKWRLNLGFDYLSAADYAYLKHCYAVNTGKSGYKNANGDQLSPQPIAVMPHLWDPPSSGAADEGEQARPPVIIGDMQDPAMTFTEYVGFGYSGKLVIEEQNDD